MADEASPGAGPDSVTIPPSEVKGRGYVVLLLEEAENATEVGRWRELGAVVASSRQQAWDYAQHRFTLKPSKVGARAQVQLVPDRYWNTITAWIEQPPPEFKTEGL